MGNELYLRRIIFIIRFVFPTETVQRTTKAVLNRLQQSFSGCFVSNFKGTPTYVVARGRVKNFRVSIQSERMHFENCVDFATNKKVRLRPLLFPAFEFSFVGAFIRKCSP